MATLTNTAAQWSQVSLANSNSKLLTKITAWADGQAPNRTLWFMVSLIAQGVLFLPIPAVLLYYFNAPIAVLAVTLGLFFSNIISGMGGAGIRVMLGFFAVSILAHLLMILVFTI
ncbi:hypothetical protein NAF17_01515 [Mucilaginibacter sp. RB4R14]|uniref:hypothetical protein n=1 Tax=Mucilaginibacter aurantiaciroseus TaxID=2949308 RepID=UPI0020913C2F|nr:hypothetical protein [Mucilaginibacter aurantiaciroseus]MCO5934202.1 hypothetical protein [Mucilaginibacter aurantiaciroseus]